MYSCVYNANGCSALDRAAVSSHLGAEPRQTRGHRSSRRRLAARAQENPGVARSVPFRTTAKNKSPSKSMNDLRVETV